MQQVGLFDTYEKSQSDLMKRFAAGKLQEDALVTVVANTLIVDKLVPVERMTFFVSGVTEALRIRYDGSKDVSIHRHALGQLCQKATLPMNFTNSLLTPPRAEEKLPRLHLLANNLRELFSMQEFKDRSGAPARFLHRTVNDELRGFLSSRFNRHLASQPLLKAFRDVCTEMGARPIEAASSPVRSSLKCLLPNVFEAFPGEHVGIGVEWSNSDFGAGKLSVCQTIWRAKTATSAVLDETISRVHLGSVITDSDLEISEETMHKEVAAQSSAIRDAVQAQLSEKTVERVLFALRYAHEEKIPWTKVRSRLQGVLTKSEMAWLQMAVDKGDDIIDLPPISYTPENERVPNLYFISSALGHIASKSEDVDKKMLLQSEAGKFLADAMTKESIP
jgi:hypothetical protein